jgi:hypothetical protein
MIITKKINYRIIRIIIFVIFDRFDRFDRFARDFIMETTKTIKNIFISKNDIDFMLEIQVICNECSTEKCYTLSYEFEDDKNCKRREFRTINVDKIDKKQCPGCKKYYSLS